MQVCRTNGRRIDSAAEGGCERGFDSEVVRQKGDQLRVWANRTCKNRRKVIRRFGQGMIRKIHRPNQMVMDETKFKDRVVLKVKKKKMTPEEFGKTEENWKKIALNFPVENALNPSNCEWLYPLLSEVEFLNLSTRKGDNIWSN